MAKGIWIRSQDKMSLAYCKDFNIYPDEFVPLGGDKDGDKITGYVADKNGRHNICSEYGMSGTYSTKEKAMAVLNCIQRHVFLENNMFIMPEDDSPNFKCEGGEIRYVD